MIESWIRWLNFRSGLASPKGWTEKPKKWGAKRDRKFSIFKLVPCARRTPMSQADKPIRLSRPVDMRDHVQGQLDAAIVLVEYGDYQCGDCREACQIVKQVQQQLNEQLCFVFRHFPLKSLHPHAQNAAEAATAAADQGKFWQMHDCLFEHQHALDAGSLVEYALNLGLNMPRFLWNFSEHVYATRVQADVLSGVESGVNGTPTFFINGIRLKESWGLDNLCVEIERALER